MVELHGSIRWKYRKGRTDAHPPTVPNANEIEEPNGIVRVISRVVRDPPNGRSASGPAQAVIFWRVLDRSGPRFGVRVLDFGD